MAIQLNDQARAYITQPRDEAVKAHPSLEKAYQAEDRLTRVLDAAKPNTPEVRNVVAEHIRTSIGIQLARNLEPQASDKLIGEVNYHVAHQSLHAALDDRNLTVPRGLSITPDHRRTLVHDAQSRLDGKDTNKMSYEERFEPKRTAAGLASLDYPKTNNPFSTPLLTRAYEEQQRYERYIEQRRVREIVRLAGGLQLER